MKWISAEDRLPEVAGDYLTYMRCPRTKKTLIMQRAFFESFKEFIPSEHHNIITHWMPLPEPPEEKT